MCFCDVPYLANIGCAASHKEALELSPNITCITVKDKARAWEPSHEETYPIIFNGVIEAIRDYDNKTAYPSQDHWVCELKLTDTHYFEGPNSFPWKGSFTIRLPHNKELPIDLIRDIAAWCYAQYAKE